MLFFQNEAMTGTYTQNPVISRITLAALEDTGWYKVDYNMADPLKWGQNLGCDFVQKSCMEWMDNKRLQLVHIKLQLFLTLLRNETSLICPYRSVSWLKVVIIRKLYLHKYCKHIK